MLAVALVDAEAGVRVTIQKMVVRIVVTKGAGDYVADAFVEIKRGFNWVVGAGLTAFSDAETVRAAELV